MKSAIGLTLSLLGGLVWASSAEDLTPAQIAQVQLEQARAQEALLKSHGGKTPSQMDASERRQLYQEQKAAAAAVFEKVGVSERDYAFRSTRLSPEELAEVKKAKEQLIADQQRKAALSAKKREDGVETIRNLGGGKREVSVVQEGVEVSQIEDDGSSEDSPPPEKSTRGKKPKSKRRKRR